VIRAVPLSWSLRSVDRRLCVPTFRWVCLCQNRAGANLTIIPSHNLRDAVHNSSSNDDVRKRRHWISQHAFNSCVRRVKSPRATLQDVSQLDRGLDNRRATGSARRRSHSFLFVRVVFCTEDVQRDRRLIAEPSPASTMQTCATSQLAFGQPPHLYLDRVRIEQSHLTRRCKRLLGITPGQFARERRSTGHEAGRRNVPSNRARVAS
jgi:hypothetical protein